MNTPRERTEQPINRTKVEELHHQYIALAKTAQKNEDRVLSESYYQRAEHYLHLLNETSGSILVSTYAPPIKNPSPVKKVIKDFNLKRTFNKKSPSQGSFLRRNRRKVQSQ